MLSKNFLIPLKIHLSFSKIFPCLPFQWDSSKGQLCLVSGKWKTVYYRLLIIIRALYTAFQVWNTIYGSFSLVEKLQSVVFILIWCTGNAFAWDWNFSKSPIQVVNALMQYEGKLISGNNCLFECFDSRSIKLNHKISRKP